MADEHIEVPEPEDPAYPHRLTVPINADMRWKLRTIASERRTTIAAVVRQWIHEAIVLAQNSRTVGGQERGGGNG